MFLLIVLTALVLMFGVPRWALVYSEPDWPAAFAVAGTVVLAGAAVALPVLMFLGHGRRGVDRTARVGDTMLGVVWVLFAWTLLGTVPRVVLADPFGTARPSVTA